MDIGLFTSDKIKSTILTILIGFPFYILFMGLIVKGGENFWIYLLGFVIVFMIIFINIVPSWIMPLFNKYEELEEGELKDGI